jgi:hypothetical protein
LNALMNRRHAACGHLHVLALEQRVFAQAGRVAIGQVVHITQAVAQFGVGAQREDAAVHIHRGVVLDRAAVGGGNVVIGIAVGLQHFHGLGQQGGALFVGECAQGGTAFFAGEAEGLGQIDAGGVDAYQFGAENGVEQGGARAGACLPAASDEVFKQLSGHVVVLKK